MDGVVSSLEKVIYEKVSEKTEEWVEQIGKEKIREVVLDVLRDYLAGNPKVMKELWTIDESKGITLEQLENTLVHTVDERYIDKIKESHYGDFELIVNHRVEVKDLTLKDETTGAETEKKWLKDKIGKSYWAWNTPGCPVFLNTPTGSGKSTFIVKTLIPHIMKYGGDISIFVPRESLKLQYIAEIEKELQDGAFIGLREMIRRKVFIETFQWLEKRLANNRGCKVTQYTVVDEAHSLLTESVYNRNATLSYNYFVNRNFASKTIFMSATGERIFEKLDKAIFYAWKCYGIRDDKYLSFFYNGDCDYSYIKLHYLYENWDIADIISRDTEGKWIVFVDNIKDGVRYQEELDKNGISAPFLHSDNKVKEAEVFNTISVLNRFRERVVISSSVLECGINLRDIKLKNVIIASNNKEQFIQMLGRKRIYENEKVNLYLDPKNKKHFEDLLHSVRRMKMRYDTVTQYGRYHSLEDLSHDMIDNYVVGKIDISVFFTGYRYQMVCNELCAEELNYLTEEYSKIIDDFDRIGPDAFLLKQLSWLGLEKKFDEGERIENQTRLSILRSLGEKIEAKKTEQDERETNMLKQEKITFLRALIPEVKKVSGDVVYATNDTTFSDKQFNRFCDDMGLSYRIETIKGNPTEYRIETRSEC